MNNLTTISHLNGNAIFYFEQLSDNSLLDGFSCQITEYNDYLFNGALRSQNDHIALTWLLRERATGAIAAYMSLIADAIKLSISEKEIHNLHYPFKTIPALKIAKLAVSYPAQEKHKRLGTYMVNKAPATRGNILKMLVDRRYISQKGKNIIITDDGTFLIENVMKNDDLNAFISIPKTTMWEKQGWF